MYIVLCFNNNLIFELLHEMVELNIKFDCTFLHTLLNFIKIAIIDKFIKTFNEKLLIP